MTETADTVSPGPLRVNRRFRLLWMGEATSELGSTMTALVVPLLTVALTGSAMLGGLLGTLGFLATWLFSVPGGYVADRYDPRRVMLVCDAVRLLPAAVMTVWLATGTPPFWLLAVMMVVSSGVMMAYQPASSKTIKAVISPDQIPSAVSAVQARSYGAALVGPPAGGVLYAVGRLWPFAADTLSYVVSMFCLWRLGPVAMPKPAMGKSRSMARSGPKRFLSDIGRGAQVLRRTPFLLSTAVYATLVNLCGSVLMYTLLLGTGGSQGAQTGTALSVVALAGMGGAILAPRLHARLGLRPLVATGLILRFTAALAAVALGAGPLVLGAVIAVSMVVNPVVNTAIAAVRLRIVDSEVYGRVSGTTAFMTTALQPLAPLGAGVLVEMFSVGVALGVVAALLAAATCYVLVTGGLAAGNQETHEPEPGPLKEPQTGGGR